MRELPNRFRTVTSARKACRGDFVRVNGDLVAQDDVVRAGDEVTLFEKVLTVPEVIKVGKDVAIPGHGTPELSGVERHAPDEGATAAQFHYEDGEVAWSGTTNEGFRILYEDRDLVVVEKPRGMRASPKHGPRPQGAPRAHEHTATRAYVLAKCLESRRETESGVAVDLDEFVRTQADRIRGQVPDSARPLWIPEAVLGADTWAGGLLVLAKTSEARDALRQVFAEDHPLRVESKWVCVTTRSVPQAGRQVRIRLDGRLAASWVTPLRRVRSAKPQLTDGKPEVEVVAVTTSTLRRRQVRRHMAYAGYPVLGDEQTRYLVKKRGRYSSSARGLVYDPNLGVHVDPVTRQPVADAILGSAREARVRSRADLQRERGQRKTVVSRAVEDLNRMHLESPSRAEYEAQLQRPEPVSDRGGLTDGETFDDEGRGAAVQRARRELLSDRRSRSGVAGDGPAASPDVSGAERRGLDAPRVMRHAHGARSPPLALWCVGLRIEHPVTGKIVRVQTGLPPEVRHALESDEWYDGVFEQWAKVKPPGTEQREQDWRRRSGPEFARSARQEWEDADLN
ncbi:unnamed protein product [Pedinophyceae sp. YPF-701]|nr:unnamed protein product [Pedinophyceae sp. YPF-701]